MFKKFFKNANRIKLQYCMPVLCGLILITILSGCSTNEAEVDENIESDILVEDVKVEEDTSLIQTMVEGEVDENGNIIADLNKLPDSIKRMLSLCEALVTAQERTGIEYNSDSPYLVWLSVQAAFANNGYNDEGANNLGDKVAVNSEVVRDYLYAMFGDIETIPSIPEELSKTDEKGRIAISFNSDLDYLFDKRDLNDGYSKINKVVVHPDFTVEIELELRDFAGNEVGCFNFLLRENTKDTSSSAKFYYEIISAKPVDEITVKRLNGNPYVVEEFAKYGSNVVRKLRDKEYDFQISSKSFDIEEVLQINKWGGNTANIDKLNKSILKDYRDNSEKECKYHEIRSYSTEIGNYLQILTTVYIYLDNRETREILTYVYDIENDKIVTREKALGLSGTTSQELTDKLMEKLDEKYKNRISDVKLDGFIILEDNSVDFYYTVNVDYGSQNIIKFNITHDELINFNSEAEIEEFGSFDDDTVSLTHGRKLYGE